MVFVPAAGLPWFVALFGRDTLIVSLQTMIVYPGVRRRGAGSAWTLGRYQAKKRDDTATLSRVRYFTNCETVSSHILG
jgi:hypothetical protein